MPLAGMLGRSWPVDGNAHDMIGGNNGTLQNGATFAPGLVGQAFSLNGVNQYILIPPSSSLNVGPTSSITVNAWVLRTVSGVPQHIVGKRQVGCGPAMSYQLALAGGSGTEAVTFGGGVPGSGVAVGVNIPLGQWTFLAGTYDGTTGTYSLYINGALVNTVTQSGAFALGQVDTAPLEIGSSGDCPPFGGFIDQVQI